VNYFQDSTNLYRCEISVSPREGHWPSMVCLSDVELEGSLLPDDARSLASFLLSAADKAEDTI
jgi:hypothetical protein